MPAHAAAHQGDRGRAGAVTFCGAGGAGVGFANSRVPAQHQQTGKRCKCRTSHSCATSTARSSQRRRASQSSAWRSVRGKPYLGERSRGRVQILHMEGERVEKRCGAGGGRIVARLSRVVSSSPPSTSRLTRRWCIPTRPPAPRAENSVSGSRGGVIRSPRFSSHSVGHDGHP